MIFLITDLTGATVKVHGDSTPLMYEYETTDPNNLVYVGIDFNDLENLDPSEVLNIEVRNGTAG